MDKRNILAIIPARGKSKRLPRKNIKLLNGKPLIAHSIEFALNSSLVNKVILSTDDDEIADIGEKFGAEVIIRPSELAQDTTKTAPVLVHVVEELKKQNYIPEIVILLQATCPIRVNNLIENAISILDKNQQYDSIFTGYQKSYTMALWTLDNEHKAKALYDYHLRPRWQEVEVNDKIIGEDGGFYAIKYDAFIKYKDFIGENPYVYEVSHTVDIDTESDFDRAESLMKGQ